MLGLSPPTRGNPPLWARGRICLGSIPAHAGEPEGLSSTARGKAVYPRPRGGTEGLSSTARGEGGLSPPTRGNPSKPTSRQAALRSIPAHAGEPRGRKSPRPSPQVYPRPRGGTRHLTVESNGIYGLSPPTRGNRRPNRQRGIRRRSIPAHAGEPPRVEQSQAVGAVYPRPRGGTRKPPNQSRARRGLSPPTRGNLRRPVQPRFRSRSIPAHAGEPCPSYRRVVGSQVYPRPRGGTRSVCSTCQARRGLSPPTRGNPHRRARSVRQRRSIPAHAGEPPKSAPRPARVRVYPRPRGGTCSRSCSKTWRMGLSPPTRGNHLRQSVRMICAGSIPAHAGEPSSERTIGGARRVYPRPRGGTRRIMSAVKRTPGLSPPTRGNPSSETVPAAWSRSIPAHAGEPDGRIRRLVHRRVYPRPRGGTAFRRCQAGFGGGLSPPTRGNPVHDGHSHPRPRSIPAHAGEPRRDANAIPHGAVYPRPRGGTRAGARPLR